MAAFIVKNIIDGNTIEVSPGWTWNNSKGTLVKILGYVVDPHYSSFAISKLNTLIKEKSVDLKNATTITASQTGNVLSCYVYLNDVDISQYFPELKKA